MRYLTFLEIFSPSDHVLKELLFVFIHEHVSDAITESYKKQNFRWIAKLFKLSL